MPSEKRHATEYIRLTPEVKEALVAEAKRRDAKMTPGEAVWLLLNESVRCRKHHRE